MANEERFEGWFIVELMGRKKTAGYVCEQSVAGAGFLRIDVPECDEQGKVTQFVRPETVYALTPTTEEIARKVAKHYRPEPIYAYEIREPEEKTRAALTHASDEERRSDYYDRVREDEEEPLF